MVAVRKHFVTFYSPGTFVSEETTKPIASWDVVMAATMAHSITERYGATPYAFQFSTRARGADDLDSKTVATSGRYYLGGKIETLRQVKARNDPKEHTLRANMECNGWKKIIVNDNSWRFTAPLMKGDTVLDWKPNPKPTNETGAIASTASA